MSFTAITPLKKKENKSVEIQLIRGESPEGNKTYAYLAMYSHRVRDLKLSLMLKMTDLEKYGVVLASGFGEPSEEVKARIQQDYFDNG